MALELAHGAITDMDGVRSAPRQHPVHWRAMYECLAISSWFMHKMNVSKLLAIRVIT